MKILVVLLVVVIGLWLLLRGRGRDAVPPPDEGARGARPADEVVPMVACTRCGVHLPRGDALADPRGRLYCGGEHRDAGPT